jgi:2-oxoglutarate ferredoxin oxidoreductase subunit gamma
LFGGGKRMLQMIVSGFGGQGILFMSKIIAYAAMLENYDVSWLPSYGPEMRGGTANCQVVISETQVPSPIIKLADILIAMNLPSLRAFETRVKPGGKIITDTEFGMDENSDVNAKFTYVPIRQILDEIEAKNLGNMVMLGQFLKLTGELKLDTIFSALEKNTPAKRAHLTEINKRAIEAGYDFDTELAIA